MDDVRGALAANLAELRKEENLTQAEFAAQFNYSDKAVSKWERGDSLPDVVMLKTIADLYGMRVDDLLTAGGVAAARAEAAYEKAKTLVSYKTLYSPVAGTVLTKNYEEGDVIAAGAPVATLGDLTDCWVKLYIPSTQLSLVKLGAKCSVFVDPFPNKAFEATVTEINQQAEYNPRMSLTQSERANMVFWIKVSIKDTEGVIKPGMPADVTIL